MANRIKGITVEIGGDTTKLSKALEGVNKNIKNTQMQLKDVEKLLKLDPKNTELLSQKQKLLADSISATKDKLATLKTAAEQANTALVNGDITQQQYDALQREIVETENELKRLETEVKNANSELAKIGEAGKILQNAGDKISGAGEKLLPVTAGVTALGTAAVKTASDFDSAMSKVAAVSGATGDDLQALRDKAREMGSKTKFSASEAAEAMNYMAMAGWKTNDMLSGIDGIMNLAAASGEDLATTSDIVTDALTAFGLTAADSGHFADVLAAASSNANTNVSMLGESFKYCAPIAGALGFSCEDTAEALGLMANAGIKSIQSGTSMRSIMTALSGEVKFCSESFGEMKIATANSDGSMRSLSDILADCRVAFDQMSESEKASAAETLVGKNAMSGFLALMNAAPADIDKLSGAIANCDGTSLQMAETMQDNLAGQLTILKSQLEELAISFGEILMPVIRDIITKIQGFVDKLNALDPATKQIIIKIGLMAAALGPLLIVVGKTICSAFQAVADFFTNIWNAISAFFTTIVTAIYTTAVTIFTSVYDFFAGILTSIHDFFDNIFNAIWTVISTVCTAIYDTISSIWNAIYSFISPLLEAFQYLFETIFQAIHIIISNVMDWISKKIQTIWNAIVAFLTPLLEGIKMFFEMIWNAIYTAISTTLSTISSVVTSVWNAISSFISSVMNTISSVISSVWNAISGAVSSVVNAIRSTVSSVWNSISSTISSVMNTIHSTVTSIWNNVKSSIGSIISGIYTTIKGGFDNAVNYVKGLASDAWNWGRDIVSNIIDGLRSMIGSLADSVSNIADTIRSYLHFSVPDVGPLTDFESWMPDFMNGLSDGINKSKKVVAKAVSGVADTMKLSLNSEQNYNLEGMTGAMMNCTPENSVVNNYYQNDNSRTVNQTNNSPKSLSRLEIYRQTKNAVEM